MGTLLSLLHSQCARRRVMSGTADKRLGDAPSTGQSTHGVRAPTRREVEGVRDLVDSAVRKDVESLRQLLILGQSNQGATTISAAGGVDALCGLLTGRFSDGLGHALFRGASGVAPEPWQALATECVAALARFGHCRDFIAQSGVAGVFAMVALSGLQRVDSRTAAVRALSALCEDHRDGCAVVRQQLVSAKAIEQFAAFAGQELRKMGSLARQDTRDSQPARQGFAGMWRAPSGLTHRVAVSAEGGTIHWARGGCNPFEVKDAVTCMLGTDCGKLTDSGNCISWSDGDSWTAVDELSAEPLELLELSCEMIQVLVELRAEPSVASLAKDDLPRALASALATRPPTVTPDADSDQEEREEQRRDDFCAAQCSLLRSAALLADLSSFAEELHAVSGAILEVLLSCEPSRGPRVQEIAMRTCLSAARVLGESAPSPPRANIAGDLRRLRAMGQLDGTLLDKISDAYVGPAT